VATASSPANRLLSGRVVVVSAAEPDAARAVAEEGAAVVIVGEAGGAGALAGEIEAAGGRACVFAGDLRRDDDRAALAEMVAELF
jgi:NAD(P)-dependent dehydrogenase (short-subunit alcohol dehydrogenase family)